GVDLARHTRLPVIKLHLGGEGCLRTLPERRQHLSSLAVVIVDRLLTDDDEEGLLVLGELQQGAGSHERLDDTVRLHVQRTIRAHCEAGPQLLLTVRRPDARYDDFLS